MSLHPILSMTHVSAGMLLALLAVLSVVLSAWIVVKTFTGHAEEAPMEQAKLVARFEHVIVGFVVLSGVIAIFLARSNSLAKSHRRVIRQVRLGHIHSPYLCDDTH